MSYPIVWSREAELSYVEVLDFIGSKWTAREVSNFINRTEQVLHFIEGNPLLFPRSDKQGIHRALISHHTSLYYELYQEQVVLLSFWDNRQDPVKNRFR